MVSRRPKDHQGSNQTSSDNSSIERVRQWCTEAKKVIYDRICCVGTKATAKTVDDKAVHISIQKPIPRKIRKEKDVFDSFDVSWYEQQQRVFHQRQSAQARVLNPILSYDILGIDEENTQPRQNVELLVDRQGQLKVETSSSEIAPSSTITAATASSTVDDSRHDDLEYDHSWPVSLGDSSMLDDENDHNVLFHSLPTENPGSPRDDEYRSYYYPPPPPPPPPHYHHPYYHHPYYHHPPHPDNFYSTPNHHLQDPYSYEFDAHRQYFPQYNHSETMERFHAMQHPVAHSGFPGQQPFHQQHPEFPGQQFPQQYPVMAPVVRWDKRRQDAIDAHHPPQDDKENPSWGTHSQILTC